MDLHERFGVSEAIRSLKARYCRYIDTKQWEGLRSLFSPSARFEGFGSAPDGADADAFVAGVSARLADAVSVHHCHTPEIVLRAPDRARAIWAMQDYVQWPYAIDLKEAPAAMGFVGYGHYEESYVRLDGVWMMDFLRLTRLRVDPLPADLAFPDAGALRRAVPNWLDGQS